MTTLIMSLGEIRFKNSRNDMILLESDVSSSSHGRLRFQILKWCIYNYIIYIFFPSQARLDSRFQGSCPRTIFVGHIISNPANLGSKLIGFQCFVAGFPGIFPISGRSPQFPAHLDDVFPLVSQLPYSEAEIHRANLLEVRDLRDLP